LFAEDLEAWDRAHALDRPGLTTFARRKVMAENVEEKESRRFQRLTRGRNRKSPKLTEHLNAKYSQIIREAQQKLLA